MESAKLLSIVFFMTIKQNLKTKSFFGTSRNAALTQMDLNNCISAPKIYCRDIKSEMDCGIFYSCNSSSFFLRKGIWIWLNKPKPGKYSDLYQIDQLELFKMRKFIGDRCDFTEELESHYTRSIAVSDFIVDKTIFVLILPTLGMTDSFSSAKVS